jgi:hypothetical protein
MTTDDQGPALPATVRAVAGGLARLPTVRALRLGGSRARGRPRSPDSDWDLLAYVQRTPTREEVRAVLPDLPGFEFDLANAGHPLQEAELSLPTTPRTDVCFRPLERLDGERDRVARSTFTLYAAPKLPIGVPSYLLLTELALSVPLPGPQPAPQYAELPVTPCTAGFAAAAVPWWRGRAACSLLLATDHVVAGEPVDGLGHVLAAVTAMAHARLLGPGRWYPITKRLLDEPGAVAEPVRRTVLGLSPAGLTTGVVRRITEEMELDERTGLDWLAAGEHLGPGATAVPDESEISTRSRP